MALQSQVNVSAALGVAGDKATPDQSIYTPINYVAGASGATVGTFCWAGSTAGVADGTGIGAPLGLVERVINYPNYDVDSAGTMTVPAGFPLTVAVKGDYWIKAAAAAAVGADVYVNNTTGAITGASGDGYVAVTGWKFKTAAAAAGDMAIISNW